MKTKTKLTIYIVLFLLIAGGFWYFARRPVDNLSAQKLEQEAKQDPAVSQNYKVDNTALKIDPKDQNSVGVILGDPNSDQFVPDLEIDRWQGETSFKLKPDVAGIPDSQKKVNLDGDKINYETPEVNYQFENKPDVSSEGGYEFSEILKTKPDTNSFTTPIETQNLDFFYQPPLNQEPQKPNVASCTETQCIDKDGQIVRVRPENVVGSYAVYFTGGKSGDYTALGGKNYKSGKAFHIYRPQVVDAQGNKVWADLHIDTAKNTLTITVPPDFLDKAVYPVTVDPTFGYTTAGGSDDGGGDNSTTTYTYGLTSTSNGNVSSITGAFYGGGSSSAKMAIWAGSGPGTPPASNATVGTYLSNSNTGAVGVGRTAMPTSDTSTWTTGTVPAGSVSVTANTYYWIGFSTSDNYTYIATDSASDYSIRWDNTAYASFPAANGSGATNHGAAIDSIYATYADNGNGNIGGKVYIDRKVTLKDNVAIETKGYACPSQTGYIMWENFEKSPSGGCCVTSCGGYQTYNTAYTTNPLEGNYSGYISESGSDIGWSISNTSAPLYAAGMFKTSASNDGYPEFIRFCDSGYNNCVGMYLSNADNKIHIENNGSSIATGTSTISTNTLYYFKFALTAGPNLTAWSSTNGSTWTQEATYAGSAVTTIGNIQSLNAYNDFSFQLDNIKVKTSDINYP